jgi:hypothetical protein
VLAKVAALPITQWSFKEFPGARHLGPMAQDCHAAFGVGLDDKHIATVDADGVALAAIQGLNEKVEDRGQRTEVRVEVRVGRTQAAHAEARDAEKRRCPMTTRSVLECGSPLPLLHRCLAGDKRGVCRSGRSSPCESARGPVQFKSWRSLAASLTFLAAALTARAQSYSMDWHTIAGGAGMSAGGVYTLSGTIGQSGTGGPMTNGPYSLVPWSIVLSSRSPRSPDPRVQAGHWRLGA